MTPQPAPVPSGDRQPVPPLSRFLRALARGPSRVGRPLARAWPYAPALVPVALTVAIIAVLLGASGLENFGPSFWGFNATNYGILIFVIGSFLTSVPALAIAMVVGLGIGIASATYLPRILAAWLDPFVDLLAGIPSIIYGLWGYLVLGPFFGQYVFPWTSTRLAFLPGLAANRLSPAPNGLGLALAIVVLVLMVLPITTVLMRDALKSVPRDLWESGLALGATRWEVTRRVAIPYSKRGIWGAAFLGFGRAIGETVAVFMVIDQAAKIPTNVYGGTSTMASLIIGSIDAAFNLNASGVTELHFLAELALVLLAITLVVNVAGRWMVRRTYTEVAGL